ncbi:MAG TPA: helix-turn-helix domain-containing protein [Psychromonas sp.]
MNQNTQILEHLKNGKKITPIEALNMFGCFRLAAVVFDLKQKGYDIQTTMIKNANKTFAEYSLNGH